MNNYTGYVVLGGHKNGYVSSVDLENMEIKMTGELEEAMVFYGPDWAVFFIDLDQGFQFFEIQTFVEFNRVGFCRRCGKQLPEKKKDWGLCVHCWAEEKNFDNPKKVCTDCGEEFKPALQWYSTCKLCYMKKYYESDPTARIQIDGPNPAHYGDSHPIGDMGWVLNSIYQPSVSRYYKPPF